MLFEAITTLSVFASLALANPVNVRDYSFPKPKGMQAQPLSTTGTVSGSCTTTIPVMPDFTEGPTQTIWTLTSTVTHLVDCGTCKALTTRRLPFGPGPAVIFTETVVATTPTTNTVMQCKPTSNIKIAVAPAAAPAPARKFTPKLTAKQKKAKAKADAKARAKAQAQAKAKAKQH